MTEQIVKNIRGVTMFALLDEGQLKEGAEALSHSIAMAMRILELKSCTIEFSYGEKTNSFRLANVVLADDYTKGGREFIDKLIAKAERERL